VEYGPSSIAGGCSGFPIIRCHPWLYMQNKWNRVFCLVTRKCWNTYRNIPFYVLCINEFLLHILYCCFYDALYILTIKTIKARGREILWPTTGIFFIAVNKDIIIFCRLILRKKAVLYPCYFCTDCPKQKGAIHRHQFCWNLMILFINWWNKLSQTLVFLWFILINESKKLMFGVWSATEINVTQKLLH